MRGADKVKLAIISDGKLYGIDSNNRAAEIESSFMMKKREEMDRHTVSIPGRLQKAALIHISDNTVYGEVRLFCRTSSGFPMYAQTMRVRFFIP